MATLSSEAELALTEAAEIRDYMNVLVRATTRSIREPKQTPSKALENAIARASSSSTLLRAADALLPSVVDATGGSGAADVHLGLYEVLTTATHVCTGIDVFLPSTVVFRRGRPAAWYMTVPGSRRHLVHRANGRRAMMEPPPLQTEDDSALSPTGRPSWTSPNDLDDNDHRAPRPDSKGRSQPAFLRTIIAGQPDIGSLAANSAFAVGCEDGAQMRLAPSGTFLVAKKRDSALRLSSIISEFSSSRIAATMAARQLKQLLGEAAGSVDGIASRDKKQASRLAAPAATSNGARDRREERELLLAAWFPASATGGDAASVRHHPARLAPRTAMTSSVQGRAASGGSVSDPQPPVVAIFVSATGVEYLSGTQVSRFLMSTAGNIPDGVLQAVISNDATSVTDRLAHRGAEMVQCHWTPGVTTIDSWRNTALAMAQRSAGGGNVASWPGNREGIPAMALGLVTGEAPFSHAIERRVTSQSHLAAITRFADGLAAHTVRVTSGRLRIVQMTLVLKLLEHSHVGFLWAENVAWAFPYARAIPSVEPFFADKATAVSVHAASSLSATGRRSSMQHPAEDKQRVPNLEDSTIARTTALSASTLERGVQSVRRSRGDVASLHRCGSPLSLEASALLQPAGAAMAHLKLALRRQKDAAHRQKAVAASRSAVHDDDDEHDAEGYDRSAAGEAEETRVCPTCRRGGITSSTSAGSRGQLAADIVWAPRLQYRTIICAGWMRMANRHPPRASDTPSSRAVYSETDDDGGDMSVLRRGLPSSPIAQLKALVGREDNRRIHELQRLYQHSTHTFHSPPPSHSTNADAAIDLHSGESPKSPMKNVAAMELARAGVTLPQFSVSMFKRPDNGLQDATSRWVRGFRRQKSFGWLRDGGPNNGVADTRDNVAPVPSSSSSASVSFDADALRQAQLLLQWRRRQHTAVEGMDEGGCLVALDDIAADAEEEAHRRNNHTGDSLEHSVDTSSVIADGEDDAGQVSLTPPPPPPGLSAKGAEDAIFAVASGAPPTLPKASSVVAVVACTPTRDNIRMPSGDEEEQRRRHQQHHRDDDDGDEKRQTTVRLPPPPPPPAASSGASLGGHRPRHHHGMPWMIRRLHPCMPSDVFDAYCTRPDFLDAEVELCLDCALYVARSFCGALHGKARLLKISHRSGDAPPAQRLPSMLADVMDPALALAVDSGGHLPAISAESPVQAAAACMAPRPCSRASHGQSSAFVVGGGDPSRANAVMDIVGPVPSPMSPAATLPRTPGSRSSTLRTRDVGTPPNAHAVASSHSRLSPATRHQTSPNSRRHVLSGDPLAQVPAAASLTEADTSAMVSECRSQLRIGNRMFS